MRIIFVLVWFLCILSARASKIGLLLNPNYCSSCNLNIKYLNQIECDTIIATFSSVFSRNECEKFFSKLGVLDEKKVIINISDDSIFKIRSFLEVPDITQSLVYLFNLNNIPMTFYDFKELNVESVLSINQLIKNNVKFFERTVRDDRFVSLGYEDVCVVGSDLISMSYSDNKIFIVDSSFNLDYIFLPENLPFIEMYKAYNANDTSGYYAYSELMSSLVDRGSSLLFQFNNLNQATDSTFFVMGTLFVAERSSYQGMPSLIIKQELMLLEFMRNKVVSVKYLKVKPNAEVSKDFFLNYTYYGKSFSKNGVDAAIEKDIKKGKKYFLINLKENDVGQLVKSKLYKIELPTILRQDSLTYEKSAFYRVDDYIFFVHDPSSVFSYNHKKERLEPVKIDALQSSFSQQEILRSVESMSFGFEFLLSNKKDFRIVRFDNQLKFLDSYSVRIDQGIKSNFVSYQDGYLFRSNDDKIIVMKIE